MVLLCDAITVIFVHYSIPIFLLLWDLCGHTLLADLKMIRGVGFVEFILVQTVYNDTVCPCLEKCILLHMQNAQQHKECWEKVG